MKPTGWIRWEDWIWVDSKEESSTWMRFFSRFSFNSFVMIFRHTHSTHDSGRGSASYSLPADFGQGGEIGGMKGARSTKAINEARIN